MANKLEKASGDVKVVIVSGDLYYLRIESLFPVAGCATGSGKDVWRVGFAE